MHTRICKQMLQVFCIHITKTVKSPLCRGVLPSWLFVSLAVTGIQAQRISPSGTFGHHNTGNLPHPHQITPRSNKRMDVALTSLERSLNGFRNKTQSVQYIIANRHFVSGHRLNRTKYNRLHTGKNISQRRRRHIYHANSRLRSPSHHATHSTNRRPSRANVNRRLDVALASLDSSLINLRARIQKVRLLLETPGQRSPQESAAVRDAASKKKQIENGLMLASSIKQSNQVFGWGAVSATVSSLNTSSEARLSNLIPKVERQASLANTVYALKALQSLYQTDTVLRHQRITRALVTTPSSPSPAASTTPSPLAAPPTPTGPQSPDPHIQFAAAIVAEYFVPRPIAAGHLTNLPLLAPSPANPSSDAEDQKLLAKLALYGNDAAPTQEIRQRVDTILNQPTSTHTLTAILLTKRKDIREAIWSSDSSQNLKLLEYLLERSFEVSRSPTDQLAAYAVSDASTKLTKELASTLSMTSLLSRSDLSPVLQSSTIPDRTVQVTPDPFVLAADYRPFPNASGVDWEDVRIFHSEINSSAVVPIAQEWANIHFPGLISPPPIDNPSWHLIHHSDTYVGVAFGEMQISGLTDVGTDGVPAYGFGVQHRIWMPVNDPNNGATFWGPGRPRFSIRFGYKPAPDTNFVAVRWKGLQASVSPITCTSGSLYSGPIETEPETRWSVFAVVPNTPLEFLVDYEAKIQQQRTRTGFTVSYGATLAQQDYIEIVELDSNNSQRFHYIDLGVKDDPILLNQPSQNNGLLTYAASLTRSLQSADWPTPDSNDPDHSAGLAMAKLAILVKMSSLDLSSLPGFGSPSPQAPWRERQALLKASLPVIAYRLFEKYNRKMELKLAVESQPLLQVVLAREKLSDALKALAQLTVDEGNASLKTAARVLSMTDNASFNDLKMLTTALIGAQKQVADLEQDLMQRKQFGCMILKNMQFAGLPRSNPGYLKMQSDPTILNLCED